MNYHKLLIQLKFSQIRSNRSLRNTLISFNYLLLGTDMVEIGIYNRYGDDIYMIEKGSLITVICDTNRELGKLHVIDLYGKITNNLPTTPGERDLPSYEVNETNLIYGTYYCTEDENLFISNATLAFRMSEVPKLLYISIIIFT